ncbi:MAG: hypothetical protein PUB21_00720 [Bacteroidales bacterium]|nr:hypothetical protein [Bacteroidales bacterium]
MIVKTKKRVTVTTYDDEMSNEIVAEINFDLLDNDAKIGEGGITRNTIYINMYDGIEPTDLLTRVIGLLNPNSEVV